MTTIIRWYSRQNDYVKIIVGTVVIYPFAAILYFGAWTPISEKIQKTSEKRAVVIAANEAAIKELQHQNDVSAAEIQQEAVARLWELEQIELEAQEETDEEVEEIHWSEWTPPVNFSQHTFENELEPKDNMEWHYPPYEFPLREGVEYE